MAEGGDLLDLAKDGNFESPLRVLEGSPERWLDRNSDGHTLLHWAALKGHRDFVLAGIHSGHALVDLVAANGQTPLMWAALNGHAGVARVLVDAGANIAICDSLGASALMIAVQHHQYASMLLLLHRASPPDLLSVRDANGCTCAHWAAYKGDVLALKFLNYFDADLMVRDDLDMLPIHRAVAAAPQAGQIRSVEYLLKQRSDPTARSKEGKTCLDMAEARCDHSMKKVLQRAERKRARPSVGSASIVDVELGGGFSDTGSCGDDEKKSYSDALDELLKDTALRKIFPVFWLVCVALSMFVYLIDLRQAAWEIAPLVSCMFIIGTPCSLALFFFTALSDPGSVPRGVRGRSGVEELMKAIDSEGVSNVDVSRLCTTTWVLKDLRTKYCKETDSCIEEFDHYCIWLNTAIGKGNHRTFMALTLVEMMTQLSHQILCFVAGHSLVEQTDSTLTWVRELVNKNPNLVLMMFLHFITIPGVFGLLLFHGRLVAINMTTNEQINSDRYRHFWVGSGNKRMKRNPFNKGSWKNNCLDFWFYQRRSRIVASIAN